MVRKIGSGTDMFLAGCKLRGLCTFGSYQEMRKRIPILRSTLTSAACAQTAPECGIEASQQPKRDEVGGLAFSAGGPTAKGGIAILHQSWQFLRILSMLCGRTRTA